MHKILKNNINVPNLKNKRNLVGGFTLVETLFAVFILTFVIVGLMTVVSSSLFSARYARDETTANYLLQEAIDYIRNDRDTTVFLSNSPSGWTDFTTKYNSCIGGDGCYFDVLGELNSGSNIKSCSSDTCPYLYYSDSESDKPFYISDDGVGNSGRTVTKFKRKIVITLNLDELIVTGTVSWKNGSIDQSRTLTTSLTNWQKAI